MKNTKMEGKSQFLENLHNLRLATIRGNLEGIKSVLAKGMNKQIKLFPFYQLTF